MTRAIHVLRHGEVENPEKILYGRQPGWRLSSRGQEMAQVVADWSSNLDLGAIHASPLQRAQETAAPIAAKHNLQIKTDDNLIEAANIFEGKKFELGSGVLRHPSSWWHLRNPAKPSWGEPYTEQIERMLAAVFAARDAANGKDDHLISQNRLFIRETHYAAEDLDAKNATIDPATGEEAESGAKVAIEDTSIEGCE